MYGVVLWCSADCRKSVIWCEDHGDLAFFQAQEGPAPRLEAGDLVKFRSVQTRRMRIAHDLVLVEQERFRDLPDNLKAAGEQAESRAATGAKVLSFSKTRGQAGPVAPLQPKRLSAM